jgi:TonB family protein
MKRALLLSSLAHVLVCGVLTIIGLRTVRPTVPPSVYTVRLIEYPSVKMLQAQEMPEQLRRTEPVKPLPPVEVERVKTRKERVDPEEAEEVEVARRTEPEVETGNEIGVGGIRVEGKEFEFPYYFEIIRRRLQSNFRNPLGARVDERMSATIFFQITQSGNIVNARVENPSGFSAFDRAAKRAVLASHPFPPLPEGYDGDILGVHCDFLSSPQ